MLVFSLYLCGFDLATALLHSHNGLLAYCAASGPVLLAGVLVVLFAADVSGIHFDLA